MGNDGGTVAKRSDIVNLGKKDIVSEERYDDISTIFTICKLTKKSLIDHPVVSDYLGNLFLKESILEFLISKEYKTNKEFRHIRNLQDVIDLKPKFDNHKLICPVEGKSTDTFIYSRNCGCVMSKKLIDNLMKQNVFECPNCNSDFDEIDIVILNPLRNNNYQEINNETYEKLKSQGLTHSKKKRKDKKGSIKKKDFN